MKRKVLIAMDTMACGGIEKAAVSMLSGLPSERYDLTLMLLTKEGDFLEQIPSWVNVVEVPLTPAHRDEWARGRRIVLREALKRGNFFRASDLLLKHIYCSVFVSKAFLPAVQFESILRGAKLDDVEYDCAMAYHNIEQAVMVAKTIRAKKKVTWFHTELSKLPVSPRTFIKYYKGFDIFAAASEAVAGELKRCFPEYANRVKVFPYVMSGNLFGALAKQGPGFTDKFDGLRILSVGRLAAQKGFDVAVAVHSRLIREGHNVRWYVAGKGPELARLQRLVVRYDVSDSFIFLGVQKNPYPFFEGCDLYVQPSRYEGYCLTVAEARSFAKPIVCTDFAGAREQIRHGETGLIVPCKEDALYGAVRSLLDSPELRRKFSGNLAQSTVDTTHEVQRLCAVLDS